MHKTPLPPQQGKGLGGLGNSSGWISFLFKKSVRLSTLSSIFIRQFIFKRGKFSLLTLHKDDLSTENTCSKVCLHRTGQRSRPTATFCFYFL